ncbi:MAG TPA: tetraacyldisaccharide 4'-kinase [Fimbriimonadaceae bacterium]|nr:tetraacyldisaccharide 4'-kinase [Fimbriimonadaceae bacterium]
MHITEVWEGRSFAAMAIKGLLLPFSGVYALGWQMYRSVYQLGLKKAVEPQIPVVCIGNLTTGGTGKTPVTVAITQILAASGRTIVVGASGYGSPAAEGASVAPDGPLDPLQWGDEPALLRSLLPAVPLIVGRARVKAAQLCAQHFPHAVLLMDDGFQHLPLQKHVTVLVEPSWLTNHFCLPAGPYREPRGNRRLANILLGPEGHFQIVQQLLTFTTINGQVAEVPKQAQMLCAIGSPQRFLESLRTSGVEVICQRALPDHDRLDAGTLFEGMEAAVPIVVTAKDWVKLQRRSDVPTNLLIAHLAVDITPVEAFKSRLLSLLEAHESQGTR